VGVAAEGALLRSMATQAHAHVYSSGS
jgi:hypothetical protein